MKKEIKEEEGGRGNYTSSKELLHYSNTLEFVHSCTLGNHSSRHSRDFFCTHLYKGDFTHCFVTHEIIFLSSSLLSVSALTINGELL